MQKLLLSDENKIERFSQYDALSKHTEYYEFFNFIHINVIFILMGHT